MTTRKTEVSTIRVSEWDQEVAWLKSFSFTPGFSRVISIVDEGEKPFQTVSISWLSAVRLAKARRE